MSLYFCKKCSSKLKTREEELFWKYICLHASFSDEILTIPDHRQKDMTCLKKLETKKFIITTDFEDVILIIPNGMYEYGEEDFIICVDFDEHKVLLD